MTGFVGMDVEAVQQLAVQLDQRSTQLRELAHTLDSMVQQLQGAWHGHDATTFAGWWQQQHRPALLACMEAIHGLAQSARNNATDQTGASGGSGSGQGPAPLHTLAPHQPGPPAPGGPDNPGGVWPPRTWREAQTAYDKWATGNWAIQSQSQYQCVAWVHYRWSSELHHDLSGVRGDGWQLADNVAKAVGEPISAQPSLHAIVSYGDSSNGHVMVVEDVRSDGSFRVSEMNSGNDGTTTGNNGVYPALPQEYKDANNWIIKGADGNYYKNGRELPPLRFAAFPG